MKRCAIGWSFSRCGKDLTKELIIVAVCARIAPLAEVSWVSHFSSSFWTFSASKLWLRRELTSEVNSPQCNRRFEQCFSIRTFQSLKDDLLIGKYRRYTYNVEALGSRIFRLFLTRFSQIFGLICWHWHTPHLFVKCSENLNHMQIYFPNFDWVTL